MFRISLLFAVSFLFAVLLIGPLLAQEGGEGGRDRNVIFEDTTVVDGQTILIPDKLVDTTLPKTGGRGGIALAAGCALLGVGLIVNRIIR